MHRARLIVVLACLCLCTTTGCLFRSHRVQSTLSNAPLKSATQQELVDEVERISKRVQTLNATVDIDTTVGGEKKGKVIEYQQIRGYILMESPKMLRMIGLLPIVRNKAFDMVSDGEQFKLSVPPRNRFFVGSNQITHVSDKTLENLRPQMMYDALIMPAIDPVTEIAVMEEGVQPVLDPKTRKMVSQSNYHLMVIRRNAKGEWHLYRKIYFNRANLRPYRQTVYDESGAIATDAVYSDVQDYNGIRFPGLIEIERPNEEYSIAIRMVKITLNEPLKPEQFQLDPPPGAIVTELR
jgi:outer membrane lipoprotein-sorting protein